MQKTLEFNGVNGVNGVNYVVTVPSTRTDMLTADIVVVLLRATYRQHMIRITYDQQGVDPTGRNTTGPPCSRRLEAA